MSKSCKNPCAKTPYVFVSRNLSKSKLPRWCRNKVPLSEDALESCYGIPESLFNRDGTLKSVCEPPSLTDSELKAVWALKSLQKEADDRVKQTSGRTNHIKERLRNVKREIEIISNKLEHPQFKSLDLGETEEEQNANIVVYAKEHLRLQRDLIECLDTEKELKEELTRAQREQWRAVAERELVAVEEEKVKPTLLYYQKQQSFKAKKRAIYEKQLRQNALITRNVTLNNVVTSLKSSYASRSSTVVSAKTIKLQTAKISRWRVQAHLKKTMGNKHDQEVQQACDQQYFQTRKYQMLKGLKKELASQKRNLIAVHEAKQKKRAAEAIKDQAVHDYIEQSGTNPYVVERLVAMEKRYNEQKKKIIDKEHERLAQLHRDFEIIEKSTQREEMRKKKWEKIWAKRFEERKKAEKAKTMKFLYTGPAEEPVVEAAKPEESVEDEAAEQIDQLVAALESTQIEAKPKSKKKSKKARSNRGSKVEGSESVRSSFSEGQKSRGSKKKSRRGSKKKKSKSSVSAESIQGEHDFFYANESMPTSLRTSETIGEYGSTIHSGRTSKKTLTFGDTATVFSEQKQATEVATNNNNDKPEAKLKISELRTKSKVKVVGPFFKWTPDVVLFSDYEVGRTYRQTVSITNISIIRMKFVLKELLDDKVYLEPNDPPPLQDMIKAKFTVSKMLSPGVAHDLVLIFSPKVSADWTGTLYFQTNEDPFQIRVECWRERFLPSLSCSQITFPNTVVNVSGVLPVIIKNTGSKRGVIKRIFQKTVQIYEDSDFLGTDNEEEEDDEMSETSMGTTIDNINALHSPPTPHHLSFEEKTTAPMIPTKSKKKSLHKSKSMITTTDGESSKPRIGSKKASGKSKKKSKNPKKERSNSRSGKGGTESKKNSTAKAKKRNESELDCKSILKDIIFTVTQDIFFAYVKECNRKLDRDKSRKICVVFRPPYLGFFRTTFEIEFEDTEVPNLEFEVFGNSVPNPIIIEPANSDMRICFMGHHYQQMLTVTTSFKGAGKVMPLIPPQLKSFVKVVPTEATVLAKSPANFCVKFRPSPSMLEEHNPISKYFDRETKLIDFPVYFKLKFPYKVDSPLTTTFLAVVTDHHLEFIPEELEMGKCSSNESVQASFTIYNNSLLSQHIGFVDLPQFISIQPNFGFATLLPHEKKEFQLLLSLPENASGNLTYKLKCQSLENQTAIFKVKVNAKVNFVHLSASRILFPVTPIGTMSSAEIEIFSIASPDLAHPTDPPKTKFQFLVPPDSPVTILPKAGHITWEKGQNILVQFTPTVSDEEVKLHAIEMLERQHIHTQALLQRELDGIEQTLTHKFGGEDYEMLGEGQHETGTGIGPSIQHISWEKSLGSFIRPAPAPSELKVELNNAQPSSTSIRPKSKVDADKNTEPKSGSNSKRNSTSSNKSAKKSKQKIHPEKQSGKNQRSSIASSTGSGRSGGKKKRQSIPLPHDHHHHPHPHHGTHNEVLSEEQKVLRDLHSRRKELIQLISIPYVPPTPDAIALGTSEYIKAKRDYLKKVKVSCTSVKIPCFITHPNEETDVLMLYCKCPVAQPSFILIEETPLVDFESVVIGSRVHKELHFHNISQSTMRLRMDTFNPYGPFAQCNASRKIPPNYVYTLRLRFKPNCTDPVTESVWATMGKDKMLVTFKGESELPNFTVAPADADYFLGVTEMEHYLFQEFAIHNGNKSRLKFAMTLVDHGECDTSTEEGKRQSSYFTDEFVHLASDPRHSAISDGELLGEQPDTKKISGPPPPTPEPKYKPPDTKRKGSKGSRGSADSGGSSKKRNSKKRSDRSSLRGSVGSDKTRLSDVKTPSLPSTPEMIHEIETNGNKLSLNTKDLVQHLRDNGQKYYFYTDPLTLPIPGGKTRLFRVYFIPATKGQFYSHFELSLEGKPIHDFHFYGTGKIEEPRPVPPQTKQLKWRSTVHHRSFEAETAGDHETEE